MASAGYVVEIAKLQLLGEVTKAIVNQMTSISDRTQEAATERVAKTMETLW